MHWTPAHLDAGGVVALGVTLAYLVAVSKAADRPPLWRCLCVVGAGVVWFVATAGPVGATAPHDFRARALAVVLLLYLVPLGLACGTPVSVLRRWLPGFSGPAPRWVAVALHPAVTSALLLVLPWVYFLGGWLPATDRAPVLSNVTGLMFVVVGYAYFHARLQVDPVPRRFHALLSLGISVVESLADGVLGLVLWLGPLLPAVAAADPDPGHARFVQVVGAGIFWLGGDVVGLPFLVSLLFGLRSDELRRAREVDAALDAQWTRHSDPSDRPHPAALPGPDDTADRRPWWETDPVFGDRYR